MRELTTRQRDVLDAIDEMTSDAGYPPTLVELGARLGIKTRQGVKNHIAALETKGYLRRQVPHRARNIELTRPGIPVLDLAELTRTFRSKLKEATQCQTSPT